MEENKVSRRTFLKRLCTGVLAVTGILIAGPLSTDEVPRKLEGIPARHYRKLAG
jgi:hypothetical protein